jgi:hypothetical protein
MAQGEPEKPIGPGRDRVWQIAPPVVLGFLVLWLGLAVPESLDSVLREIARTLGGAT